MQVGLKIFLSLWLLLIGSTWAHADGDKASTNPYSRIETTVTFSIEGKSQTLPFGMQTVLANEASALNLIRGMQVEGKDVHFIYSDTEGETSRDEMQRLGEALKDVKARSVSLTSSYMPVPSAEQLPPVSAEEAKLAESMKEKSYNRAVSWLYLGYTVVVWVTKASDLSLVFRFLTGGLDALRTKLFRHYEVYLHFNNWVDARYRQASRQISWLKKYEQVWWFDLSRRIVLSMPLSIATTAVFQYMIAWDGLVETYAFSEMPLESLKEMGRILTRLPIEVFSGLTNGGGTAEISEALRQLKLSAISSATSVSGEAWNLLKSMGHNPMDILSQGSFWQRTFSVLSLGAFGAGVWTSVVAKWKDRSHKAPKPPLTRRGMSAVYDTIRAPLKLLSPLLQYAPVAYVAGDYMIGVGVPLIYVGAGLSGVYMFANGDKFIRRLKEKGLLELHRQVGERLYDSFSELYWDRAIREAVTRGDSQIEVQRIKNHVRGQRASLRMARCQNAVRELSFLSPVFQ